MKKLSYYLVALSIITLSACANEAPTEEQQEEAVIQEEERDSLIDEASELLENADWGDEESDSTATEEEVAE